MAVPLATGSLGYAPTNEGGLADVFQGTTTDALDDEKLKRLLAQQQMFQATAPQRQAIGQEVYNDPSLADNKDLMKQLQRLYSGTGVSAPITPYKPAQPGVIVAVPATPEKTDATGPNGMIMSGATQDPMSGTPGEQGTDAKPASGGISWQDLYNPDPNSKIAQVQNARDKIIEDNFSKGIVPIMKNGVPAQVQAFVHGAMAEAAKAGWTPEQIETTFEPYLQQGVAAMSPKEVAQAGKLGEQTTELSAMLQPRLQEIASQTALNKSRVEHLRDIQADFLKMLGPKQSLLAAQTKQALNNAAQLVEKGDMEQQEADWYGKRVDTIAANRGQNPQEWSAALRSLSTAADNSQQVVRGLQQSVVAYQSSLASMDPQSRIRTQSTIDQINAEIQQEESRYNFLVQQQNELMQVGNFAQPGMSFQQPYEQGPGVTNPGPTPTFKPPDNKGNSQGALAPTKVNPANGKTYYLWKSDQNYHPTPEGK